jgi:hypothetical protein
VSTYAQLQTRVSSNVIDSPTPVQTNIPVFINAAIEMAQSLFNFNAMKAEIQAYLTTNSTTNHLLLNTPIGFKEPRGTPYWLGTSGIAASATVAGGGTGYAVGDIIQASGGDFTTPATFRVATLSVSAIATVTVVNPGSYNADPTNPNTVTSLTGAGTGATLTITFTTTTNTINRIDWAPNRTYVYRQWNADSATVLGSPTLLLLGENVVTNASGVVTASSAVGQGMPIYIYPFSDGLGPSGGQYPIYIPYWAILPDLSNSSDTNWFATYMTEFIVSYATKMAFEMDWDEQRATYWQNLAFGPKWDGVDVKTAGGWFKVAIELDKRIGYSPIRSGT